MHKYTEIYIGPHLRSYIGTNAFSNMFLLRSERNAKAQKWKKPPPSPYFILAQKTNFNVHNKLHVWYALGKGHFFIRSTDPCFFMVSGKKLESL